MSGLTVSFLKSYSANNGYSNSIHLEVYKIQKNKIQKTTKLNIHNDNVLNSLQHLPLKDLHTLLQLQAFYFLI